MADTKITALSANTALAGEDLFPIANDPAGTPSTESIKASYALAFGAIEGELIGGKLSVTVASNNITVAVVTNSGGTPSSTNPVGVKINNTVRNITGALSVTVNAGTNSFNAGSAELATLEVQYFAYVAWRSASSAVVIGFSRIPYAALYSDFSATATSEKYGAFSTAPASSDDCTVVGRFSATLSAGAGYTWTVPTFTSSNLIQRPVDETDWLTWAPTLTGFSANPTTTVYQYKIKNRTLDIQFRQGVNGTSNATTFTATLPFTARNTTNQLWLNYALLADNGTNENGIAFVQANTATLTFNRVPTAAFTGSGGKRANHSNRYEIA